MDAAGGERDDVDGSTVKLWLRVNLSRRRGPLSAAGCGDRSVRSDRVSGCRPRRCARFESATGSAPAAPSAERPILQADHVLAPHRDFQQVLDDHQLLASIGSVGDAFDNAMAEELRRYLQDRVDPRSRSHDASPARARRRRGVAWYTTSGCTRRSATSPRRPRSALPRRQQESCLMSATHQTRTPRNPAWLNRPTRLAEYSRAGCPEAERRARLQVGRSGPRESPRAHTPAATATPLSAARRPGIASARLNPAVGRRSASRWW
jgi:hypothetical protein